MTTPTEKQCREAFEKWFEQHYHCNGKTPERSSIDGEYIGRTIELHWSAFRTAYNHRPALPPIEGLVEKLEAQKYNEKESNLRNTYPLLR